MIEANFPDTGTMRACRDVGFKKSAKIGDSRELPKRRGEDGPRGTR